MGSEVSQAYWDKDADYPKCRKCNSSFSLLTRRHHCRCCFHIFCGGCTAARGTPQGLPYNEPVRLCDSCASNARAKKQCGCRPDLAHLRKGVAGAAGASAGADSAGKNPDADGGDGKKHGDVSPDAHHKGGAAGAAADADQDGGANQQPDAEDSAATKAASQEQSAREVEESAQRRIDAITRQLNGEIVNLGPFNTNDYGLYFSEDPVYGMRIATVVGPVAFSLPQPDPANIDGVAQLFAREPTVVPTSLQHLHSTPLPMIKGA